MKIRISTGIKADGLLFLGLVTLFLSGGSILYLKFGGITTYTLSILFSFGYWLCGRSIVKKNTLYTTVITFFIILGILLIRFILDALFGGLISSTPIKLIYRSVAVTILLIAYRESNRSILDDLYLILKITAIHALFNFIIINFFLFNNQTIQFDNYSVTSTLGIFFLNNQLNVSGIMLFRNMSFFWEPGVLAVYMNIFLFLALYLKKNRSDIFLSILIIFTTISTLGLIALVFILTPKIIDLIKKKPILLPVLILISIYPIVFIANNIEYKFKENKGSSVSRISDLTTGAYVLYKHPLIGIGFNETLFEDYRANLLNNKDKQHTESHSNNSNGFVDIFVKFGLLFSFPFFLLFYRFANCFKEKYIAFFMILICLSGEPLFLSGIFLLFLFLQKKDLSYQQ